MSFNIALSGLNATSEQLSSISHNIANVGTSGFKSSRTLFGSLYADVQALGVEVIGMSQNFGKDGSANRTGNNLDLAIAGGGFFVMRGKAGEQLYTRSGAFTADSNNRLVGPDGASLQGYPVDAAGNLQVGTVGDLTLQSGNLAARATDSLGFIANLDTGAKVPTVTPFDPANADSYNSTYTTRVIDSQGQEHTLTQYFVKAANNSWMVHYYADGVGVSTAQPLTFGTDGALTGPLAPVSVSFSPPGVAPLTIALDYSGTSQYGSAFSVTKNQASGYTAGERNGVQIESDGKVYATFSNGQRLVQGQVVLASFVNTAGLKNQSGTRWSETGDSGAALLGTAGAGTFGTLTGGALEGSNVEMTEQLVGLMEGQRNYQANSKVLSTYKELNQVLFNAV